MDSLERIFQIVLGYIVKLVGVIMVLSVLLQIAVRYLPITILWTEEMARLTFLLFAYTGSVLAMTKNMHLAIDYFYDKFSRKPQRVMDYIVVILMLVFSFVIMFYGIKLVQLVSIQRSPVFGLSMSVFYAPVPWAGLLIFIYLLCFFIDMIKFDKSRKSI